MKRNEVFIHPSATVHAKAKLDADVWVGPFCFIGQNVTIGKSTRLEANVFIDGHTEIGSSNHFSPYSSIGTDPQDLIYKGEKTLVKIGGRNIFREFVTVNRGTVKGGGKTTLGNNNYFMAYSHIGHDCTVGNETIFVNSTTLAGHVDVDDYVYISASCGIHQFCRIGKYAFLGGYSVITQDVLPFARVVGSRPALLFGANIIGLRRQGFSKERIRNIKEMFKIIFYTNLNTSQAVEQIQEQFPQSEDVDEIVNFIKSSQRGIIKKTAEKWQIELE